MFNFFISKVWEHYEEPKNVSTVEETERKTNFKRVFVTEVGKELDFYAQHAESGNYCHVLNMINHSHVSFCLTLHLFYLSSNNFLSLI